MKEYKFLVSNTLAIEKNVYRYNLCVAKKKQEELCWHIRNWLFITHQIIEYKYFTVKWPLESDKSLKRGLCCVVKIK